MRLAHRLQDRWETPLLLSIPNLSLLGVASLLAALGSADRFQTPKQAVSYLGLAPCLHESDGKPAGRTPQRPTIGWGNRQARHQLFHAALSASHTPGPLRAFYRELCQHKPPKKALLAVARKLLTLAWHVLHRRQPCRWENQVQTEEKIRQVALLAGGPRMKTGPKPGAVPVAWVHSRTRRILDKEPAQRAEQKAYELRAQHRVRNQTPH